MCVSCFWGSEAVFLSIWLSFFVFLALKSAFKASFFVPLQAQKKAKILDAQARQLYVPDHGTHPSRDSCDGRAHCHQYACHEHLQLGRHLFRGTHQYPGDSSRGCGLSRDGYYPVHRIHVRSGLRHLHVASSGRPPSRRGTSDGRYLVCRQHHLWLGNHGVGTYFLETVRWAQRPPFCPTRCSSWA